MSHYYRFSYISSTGGDDPKYQATAKLCGSVIVDVVIKTETPLQHVCPIINWVKSKPDCLSFSSWDKFSPEIVARFKTNLDRRAVEFIPDVAESDQ